MSILKKKNRGEEKKYCCFCGVEIINNGCNPDPASNIEDDRCCFECDQKIVIPARQYIYELIRQRKEETA